MKGELEFGEQPEVPGVTPPPKSSTPGQIDNTQASSGEKLG